ncbi:hypothetical protein R4Y45_00240 [Holzapfeliella sp. He02]|uniref:DUF5776 domain-containing protein n=1 Tax=Holzapfeliella saturejae TaxID=3082953 RepID=A0ABU8SE73_9LACO
MYNKNKIQKTNEKKIMKKVKKQWVVASLATFALIGGAALNTSNVENHVLADTSESSDNGGSTTDISDNGGSTTDTSDNGGSTTGTSDNGGSTTGTSDNGGSTTGTSDNGGSTTNTSDNGGSTTGTEVPNQQQNPESDYQKGISEGTAAAQNDANMNNRYLDGSKAGLKNLAGQSPEYQNGYNMAYNAVVDGTNNKKANDATLVNNDDYLGAYAKGQDIRNATQTVMASNATQLNSAMLDTSIKNIKVVRDISMWQLSGQSNVPGFANGDLGSQAYNKALTINGGGHTVDFASYNYSQNSTDPLKIQDITMYGTAYYGPITKRGASGQIWYDNINYYGPQLAYATASEVHVNNKVYIDSRNPNYDRNQILDNPADNPGTGTINMPAGYTNQQNLQVATLIFEKDSEYDGYTNNGNVLELNGTANVTLNSGSRVNLYPRNNGATNPEDAYNGYAVGLYMNSGVLNINDGAHLNIEPQTTNTYPQLSSALYLGGGSINVNSNSAFSIKLDGSLTNGQIPIYVGGNLTAQDNGEFIVEKLGNDNSSSASNTLAYVSGSLNIKNKANIGMYANGSSNISLLSVGSNVNISNPADKTYTLGGKQANGLTFDLRDNTGTRSSLFTNNNLNLNNVTLNGVPYGNVLIPSSNNTGDSIKGTNLNSSQVNDQNNIAYYGGAGASDNAGDTSKTRFMNFLATPNFKLDSNSLKLNRDQNTGNLVLSGSYQFMDSAKSNYSNKSYPIYLGAFVGNTSQGGTYTNDNYKIDKNSYNLKSTKDQDYSDNNSIPFAITLPNNLTAAQIQRLSVQGQYIVGSDNQQLQISASDANNLAQDTTIADSRAGVQTFINNRNNNSYQPTSDSRYPANTAYKNGYDIAQAGYTDGYQSNTTNNRSNNYPDGYQRTAYDTGFNQGQADYTANTTGYNDAIADKQNNAASQDLSVQSAYTNGYNAGKDVLKAIKDVTANPKVSKQDGQSPSYNDAYDGASKALDSSYDNKDKSQQSHDYQKGYDSLQGMQKALRESSHSNPNDDSQSDSYKLTAKGIQDAQNGVNPAASNSPFYQAGYNDYQNGISDFNAGVKDPSSDNTKSQVYKDAYADAAKGYKAYTDNPTTATIPDGSSQAYKVGFNATRAAAQGMNDYLNDGKQTKADDYKNDSVQNDAYQKAYSGAQQAANDYNNGNVKSANDLSKESKAYQDGYNAVAVSQKAMADAKNNENHRDDSGYTDAQKAIYQEVQKAVSDALQETPSKSEATPSATYNYAYDTTLGAKDYVDGKPETGDSNNYKQAYEQAKAGHDAYKADSNQSTSGKSQAYVDGFNGSKTAKAGSDDYQNQSGKSDKYGKDKAYTNGYDGAQAGTQDGLADKSTNVSSKPQVYQDAYGTARDKSEDARTGLQDALAPSVNGAQNTNNSDYMSGYNGAKDGAVAAVGTQPTGEKAKNAQYVAAYNRAQGMKDALANPDKATADNSDANYKDGYNTAHQGIVDGLAKADKNNNTDQTYNHGYDDLVAGANDYTNGTSSANKNAAYNKGYTEARNGHDDAQKSNAQAQASTEGTSKQYQDSYNATRAAAQGMNDYLNDGKQTKASDYTGNTIQNDAYQKAYSGAQQAANDYNNGNVKSANDLSKESKAYQDGYNAVAVSQKAMADAKAGENHKDGSGYTDAQKAIYQEVQQAVSDALQETPSKSEATPSATYNYAYDTTLGAKDYVDGKPETGNSNNYKQAYEQARAGHDAYKADANQSTSGKSQAYVDGFNGSKTAKAGSDDYQNQSGKSDKYGEDKAYTNGYDGAQVGTQDGLADKSTNVSSKPQVYQDAYGTARDKSEDARTGLQDALAPSVNGAQNTNNSDYMSGYNGAKDGAVAAVGTQPTGEKAKNAQYVAAYNRAQGMKDALANPDKATADNSDANYKDGYNTAHQGIVDGLAKADKNNNTDQTYNHGYDDLVAGANDYTNGTSSANKNAAYNKGYTEARNGHDDAQKSNAQAQASTEGTSKQYQDSYNATRAAAQGMNDYLNDGKQTKASDYTGNTIQNDAYQKAYSGAQQAANDYNNGNVKSANDLSKESKAYQDGYNAVAVSQKAMADAKNNENHRDDSGYTDAQKAIYQEVQKAVSDALQETPSKSEATPSATYNYAYDTTLGAKDYVDGKPETGDSNNYKQAYEQAKAGHDAYKADSNQSTSGKSQAYVDGFNGSKTAKAGSDDYQNQSGKSDKYGKDKAYTNGYDGAQAGTQDGLADKSTNVSSKPQVYQDAYGTARDKSEDARTGLQDALAPSVNGAQNTNNSDYMSGYNGAKDGAVAAVGTQPTGEKAKNAQYVAAYNRAQGMKDALANPDKATADNSDANYKDGYNTAHQGIVDGLAKADKNNNTDQTYNHGYDDLVAGANDYTNGTSSANKNAAYNKGYTEARNGHDDAQKSNAQAQASTEGTSKQYQDSYNATRAAAQGMNDYLNDGKQTKASDYTGNTIQNDAYQKAYSGAQDGQTKGLTGMSATDNSAKPVAYQDGYKSGYSKGYASYQNSLTNANVNAVQAMVENGQPIKDYTGPYASVYKQAYEAYQDGAVQAAQDFENGIKPNLANQSKAYINGYNSLMANAVTTKVNYTPNANVLVWSLDKTGQPVPTDNHKQGYRNIVATKETKVVDGISYTKLATGKDSWIQTQYLDDPASTPMKVNYTEGYGVRIWNSEGTQMSGSDMTESALANVKTYDQKVVDNISYTRINAKDSNQWIQTQYLQNTAPKAGGVVSLGNVPQNYAIYLRDSNGNMTEQALKPGTSWKVFEGKNINGQLFYRLGSDNQWVEAKYIDGFKA